MGIKLTPAEKVSRAIIDLQEKNPFFAHLTFGLEFKEAKIPTMAVSAKGECLYNLTWVDGLKREELQGVLCHEVLHVAIDHLSRLGHRRLHVANVAMDIAVNHIVKSNNLTLPEKVIPVDLRTDSTSIDVKKDGKVKKVKVENVSKRFWEDIYNQIEGDFEGDDDGDEEGEGTPGGNGEGSGGRGGLNGDYGNSDGHIYGDGMTEKEREKTREDWTRRVTEAATSAKTMGKTPAGMERYIDKLLKPKVRWKDMLRSMIKPYITPVDYSYRKPNKKSVACGVFLPSVRKEHMEVEVLVDTSGSIGQAELTEFLSEVCGIAASSSHVKMWVSFCDTEIGNRYEVANGNIHTIMALKPSGGGGTDMENGLDRIKKENTRVPVVVVLTDGYDSYKRKRSDYPFDVIWCLSEKGVSISDHAAGYGMRVKIDG